MQEINFLEGGDSWDLVVSTPVRAEKTPSALQGASQFSHQAGARAAPARHPSSAQERPRAPTLGPKGLGL